MAILHFSKFKVQGLDIEILLGAEGPQQGLKGPQPSPGARRKGAQCPELLVDDNTERIKKIESNLQKNQERFIDILDHIDMSLAELEDKIENKQKDSIKNEFEEVFKDVFEDEIKSIQGEMKYMKVEIYRTSGRGRLQGPAPNMSS